VNLDLTERRLQVGFAYIFQSSFKGEPNRRSIAGLIDRIEMEKEENEKKKKENKYNYKTTTGTQILFTERINFLSHETRP